MSETEQFSALVSGIYDASLDASLWPSALEATCGFVRGCAANMFWQDSASNAAAIFYSWGDDPHYRQLYFEHYVKLNPLFPALTFMKPGVVVSTTDIIPMEEFVETRFYKEWVHPQGVVDVLVANLEKSPTSSAAFSVRRGVKDGMVDNQARNRMQLVVPHVQRAAAIGHIVDQHKIRMAALSDTLNGLAAGVFLVNATGGLVFVNAPGQAMLDDGRILRDGRGILSAVDPLTDRALRETFVAAASGDAAVGVRGVGLRLPGPLNERWLAHVLPLTSGQRAGTGLAHRAVAAVFVRKAALDLPSPPEVIAEEFRLTPSELRVLFALVEVGSVSEVAEVLGISDSTVRTHLRSLFAKTGVSRQAQLVRLVASYSTPLLG